MCLGHLSEAFTSPELASSLTGLLQDARERLGNPRKSSSIAAAF